MSDVQVERAKAALTFPAKIRLAKRGMAVAVKTRLELGVGLEEPICAYSACSRLNVPVRFVDIDMEAVYRRLPVPRIFLSAYRPLARRHFSCAHELGHHLFGHGLTLEESQRSYDEDDSNPDEFLVNAFAAHFLMPVIGVRQAFVRRGIRCEHATPLEILAIATEYGVSYGAMVTHLAVALRNISSAHRAQLLRQREKSLQTVVPEGVTGSIAFVDAHFAAATLDVEVDHILITPLEAFARGEGIEEITTVGRNRIFQAVARGRAELVLPKAAFPVSVRIAAKSFVGLAHFRHLEEE